MPVILHDFLFWCSKHTHNSILNDSVQQLLHSVETPDNTTTPSTDVHMLAWTSLDDISWPLYNRHAHSKEH